MVAKNPDSTSVNSEQQTQKKGRPTPKRRDAQARHMRPLVPADRKAAKRADREKRNEAFRREQEALRTGDERYMPYAHRGKVRRFIRDTVDTRWSFSEFIVPVMLLFLVGLTVLTFVRPADEIARYAVMIMSSIFYGLFLISIVEGFIVWRRTKREIAERFPNESIARGSWFYMYSRMVMARRWRTPSPQIERGASL